MSRDKKEHKKGSKSRFGERPTRKYDRRDGIGEHPVELATITRNGMVGAKNRRIRREGRNGG